MPGGLTVVDLAAPAAAEAVRRHWDGGRAVLVLDPRAPRAEAEGVLARLAPDRPVEAGVAAVVATSGTTGRPRGVELTFDGLVASARAVTAALGAGAGDTWLCCLPPHRVAGLAVVARSWATGIPLRVLDRFDPEGVAAAADEGATLVSLVPTMARRLLAAGVDPASRFRRVLLGGGPVPDDLRGVRTYGLTETWGGIVHDGLPLTGVAIRLDPTAGGGGSSGPASGTAEADPGGEILVRGPMVALRYRCDAAATAAAFAPGGWLRTGDLGGWGPDGRLRVLDRLADIVISGGVSISPAEVEAVLRRHPAVAEVAVAGTPDPEWGERVVAHVVPADPSSPPRLEELRAFARDRLSSAKLPRQVVLVPGLPRNPEGKLLRRLLGAPDPDPAGTDDPDERTGKG